MVSSYLLVRMEGKLDKLSSNIDLLTRAIEAALKWVAPVAHQKIIAEGKFKICSRLFVYKRYFMKLLISLILLCCTSLCSAETLHGIVTYVYDGDTIIVQADNQYYRIRLASIDAPELDQPYGLEAKRTLGKLVYNKPIIAYVIEIENFTYI